MALLLPLTLTLALTLSQAPPPTKVDLAPWNMFLEAPNHHPIPTPNLPLTLLQALGEPCLLPKWISASYTVPQEVRVTNALANATTEASLTLFTLTVVPLI